MKLKELLNIMGAIASEKKYSQPFICGGTPRDKYLKKLDNISDLDITTGDKTIHLLAKDLSEVLSKKYQINVITAADGHTSMNIGDLKVDFSSNFLYPNIEEILIKKGIKNPTNMQKEMYSRDFTCNALLLSFDLKTIIDPTNRGLKDIREKRISTILEPYQTFNEFNKNRVVRSVYLSSKLGFTIDEKTKKWIKENPEYIKLSSAKTISEKLGKAMEYDPKKTLSLLDELQLWSYIPITEKLYPYYLQRLKEKKNVQKG